MDLNELEKVRRYKPIEYDDMPEDMVRESDYDQALSLIRSQEELLRAREWVEIKANTPLTSQMELGRYMRRKWVITRLESEAEGWSMIHPNEFYTHYRLLNPPAPPEAADALLPPIEEK